MKLNLSKSHTRVWAMITAIVMLIQSFGFTGNYAEASALNSTYVDQNQIHYVLPKASIKLEAKALFNGLSETATVLNDVYGNGTYLADVQGYAPNQSLEYSLYLNNKQIGSQLTTTSDPNGTLQLSFKPTFKVAGSFDSNFTQRHELLLSGDNYSYVTNALADGDYQYKYILEEPGIPEYWFLDPTNSEIYGDNNRITVGVPTGPLPDQWANQPGGNSKWVVAGSWQGWNNASDATQMKHLVGEFYAYSVVLDAGTHEFKLVRKGSWDGYANNGNNFTFTLTEKSKVNIYINDEIGQARISVPNVVGLAQYTPELTETEWPRLVGDIQKVWGEKEWEPGEAKQLLVDYNFDGSLYMLQRTLPAGKYEMKVVQGDHWGVPDYGAAGGGNFVLQTLDPADVTFSINLKGDKALSSNYKPADGQYDGLIQRDRIAFDSRSVTYKKPFGAIKEAAEDLTLRIETQAGDVQLARAELTNPQGIATAFDMKKVTTFDDKDYWEIVVPKSTFQGIGIWGYKFILIDGLTKVEYGDDSIRGGQGMIADEGVLPYELTVYKQDFTTPEWMKNAVVYQIFPDRFFDGNEVNNRAKTADGYRGGEMVQGKALTSKNGYKLQYFDGGVTNDPTPDQVEGDWSTIPESVDRTTPENKPYHPDAKSDGVWTNEFYGGDLQGVAQKLNYLKSIGVTVIYFNPIAWAGSNHKYDATDYKHLDPMFGEPVYNTPGDPKSGLNYEATRVASDRVFTEFAKQAYEKGIRVIVDGVFNHVGDDSIYFDRYSKYPEIGAYEYWAKVYDKMKADKITEAAAEQAVIASYTAQVNPATGSNYRYPEDFDFTKWFKVENEMIGGVYKYEGWWGYDSLPVIEAPEPAAGDSEGLEGNHEWNVQSYRDLVIGHDLTGATDAEASQMMQNAASQRWNWMGARGWRLDVAPDVSDGTWQKFRDAVKSTDGRVDTNGKTIDEPFILGEEWGVATRFLLGDQFDSVMNYRFRSALQSYMLSGNASQLHEALESIREDYPEEAWEVMLNLVDSHDTIRSVTKYDKPEWEEEKLIVAPDASDKALKLQALTAIFQMGYPGAPTIYYGDEVGVTGTKDPDSRRTFPWERVTESGGQYNAVGRYAELLQTYQQAAQAREDNEAFRTGKLKIAYSNGDVIAYARKTDTKAGLIVINRGAAAVELEADTAGFLPEGLILRDQLGSGLEGTVLNGKIKIKVPALSGLMMSSTTDLVTIPAVTRVQAVGGNKMVTLTWDAAAAASSYNIYRAPIEGGQLQKVGDAAVPTWIDTNVENGKKYYYTVTAVVSGGESPLSEYAAATPSYPIRSVEITKESDPVTLGVGNKTSEILVTIDIPGLTDDAALAGKEAPGVIARLVYYPVGSNQDDAADAKLRYKEDTADGKKVYWVAFEPTEAGVYTYYAKVSTDNGDNFTESVAAAVTVTADPNDTTPPAAPVLASILVESNRVQLKWTVDDADQSVNHFEIYRKTANTIEKKIAVVEKGLASYIDFTVSNDTTYTYRVAAVDKAYNRAYSNAEIVTPKLVMVDVKLRVHLPSYTPAQDDIYLAGNLNGWNEAGYKLSVPSGLTNRDVVEYSFKMMAGKSIEYKYTRGTWETEGLTSNSRSMNNPADWSNYAYSDNSTNMKLTISNQGNNQMVVNDYILRWVDMPMLITLPRISFGEKIEYETTDANFTLKANVPYGVAFTINGQPIDPSDMDAAGNVLVEQIPLQVGVNTFSLHIEPTAETLALPWYTEQGRAFQATKTIEMVVTRKSSGGSNNGGGSSGGDNGSVTVPEEEGVKPNDSMLVLTEQQIRDAVSSGKPIDLDGKTQAVLPLNSADLLGSKLLELKQGNLVVGIPADVLKQLLKQVDAAGGKKIVLQVKPLTDQEQQQLLKKAEQAEKAKLLAVSKLYELRVMLIDADGKEVAVLSKLEQPLPLSFEIGKQGSKQQVWLYSLMKDGQLTFEGGTWSMNGTALSMSLDQLAAYIGVLEYSKPYTDVAAGHWAADVIQALSAMQIVTGTTADRFEPAREITRAEFTALLVRALGLEAAKPAAFADVKADAWYASAVAAAAEAGLVQGRTDAQFAPNNMIKREEMALMAMRAWKLMHDGKEAGRAELTFADAGKISSWAQQAIQGAVEQGLMKGKAGNSFDPQGQASRAESAQVIFNLLNP